MRILLAIFFALPAVNAQTVPAPGSIDYRYAYSCDGYNQDRDDVAASALTLALLDRAGRADRLVHLDFNTNFGGKPAHAEEHRKSVLQTAVLFGITKDESGDGILFDVSESAAMKQAAITQLAGQMRLSTDREPLMMICAGGVQVVYAALHQAIADGASAEALRSLTFISHSQANEQTAQKNADHPEYANNWPKLKLLSPTSVYFDYTSPRVNGRRNGGVFPSQNSTAWNQAPRSGKHGVAEWQWLKGYGGHVEGFGFAGTKGEWLLTRLKAAGAPEIGHNGDAEGDASDAAMVYIQLPGGQTDATMEDIKSFFMGQAGPKVVTPPTPGSEH